MFTNHAYQNEYLGPFPRKYFGKLMKAEWLKDAER